MSMENFSENRLKEPDFEKRMQEEYISQIYDNLVQLEAAVTDLEDRPHLKDVLSELRYQYDTIPESRMDELQLAEEKSGLELLSREVLNIELTNDQREAINRGLMANLTASVASP